MDRELIEQKLESLRHCVQRIQQKCPEDAAALARNLDAQDIVSLNLTRAVQLCVDLGAYLIVDSGISAPDTMGHIFDALAEIGCIDQTLADRLKKAVSFRNIAVHNDLAIDWQIVHAIAQTHLDDFTVFARQIHAHILRGPAGE